MITAARTTAAPNGPASRTTASAAMTHPTRLLLLPISLSFLLPGSGRAGDGVVGERQGGLEGVQDGVDLVLLVPDAPQGAALALQGPPGDDVAGDRAQAEEVLEVGGDAVVLAVEDLDVGQVQQVLGDGDGLGAGVADGEQVGGFVGVGPLDVPGGAGQAQVLVEGLHRLGAQAHLLPHLVAHVDPQVPRCRVLAHPPPPGGQAGQGDPDGLVPQRHQPGQRQGRDGGVPVDVDGGVGVEQSGQRPVDELAEGVAQQPGLVEELPGARVPALLDELRGGGGQLVPQGGDGGLDQVGWRRWRTRSGHAGRP